jgi:hypothetical protein
MKRVWQVSNGLAFAQLITAIWAATVVQPLLSATAASPSFPLKVSGDRRYLVDQQSKPFFVMGDTPWFVQKLKIEDVRMLMDDRLGKGFNTLFLEILDDSRIPSQDGYGNLAFQPDTDITKSVEAYWRYAEQVMDEAEKRGLFIIMSDLWYGYGDGLWMHHVKPGNAKVYGAIWATPTEHRTCTSCPNTSGPIRSSP